MEDSTEDMRLTGRAIGEFVLRWAEISGPKFGGDLVTAMLNRQYADTPPPDALRRPISVSSIAASLNLPRETVRRHVRKMLDAGSIVSKDGGVIVPKGTVASADGQEAMKQLYAAARRFVLSLRRPGSVSPRRRTTDRF